MSTTRILIQVRYALSQLKIHLRCFVLGHLWTPKPQQQTWSLRMNLQKEMELTIFNNLIKF